MLPGGGFIVLDTAVTPALAAEGLARDVMRAVQQARRAAGLDVSDRISLVIAGSPAAQQAMRAHQELIARETLATAVDVRQRRRARRRPAGPASRSRWATASPSGSASPPDDLTLPGA